MNRRTGALLRASGALFVLLAISAGCATPVPSVLAPPSASTSASPALPSSNPPSPSPSTAAAPKVVCGKGAPIGPTLTCNNAVAAAEAVVGPDPAIAYIEFHFGRWCPPGFFCVMSLPNTGYVIFHVKGLRSDILVTVVADEAGTVTASSPQPLPSPSA